MFRQGSLGPSRSASTLNLLASIPESPKRHKERDDDDIVEVMKVRRSEGMPDVAYANGTAPVFRKPKTLRSRTVQALRSIKNVGKVPRRPALEQVFPAKENNGHTTETSTPTSAHAPAWEDNHSKVLPTQPSTPLLKKRASQPLSNLFGLGQGHPASAPSVPDAPGPTSTPSKRFRTLTHLRSASAPLTASASMSALHLPTDGPARPKSPSFSLRGTRPKFSFVNLQSMFSAVPHDPERESVPEPGPESPVAMTTDVEMDHPDPAPPRDVQAPDDDGWDSDEDYDSPRRHATLGTTMRRLADVRPSLEQLEFSSETRINSLHFDSFSFDADAF